MVHRLVFSLLLVSLLTVSTSAGQERPNIVFILADDLGWRDVGFMGSSFYETPNLDRLAQQGMGFTNAYAAAPVCSPTRAAILTGKYPARPHITDWIPGRGNAPDQKLLQVEDRAFLPLKEETLAEVLGQAGYATASIGKWHLGGEGHLPTDQGFDVNIGGYDMGNPRPFGGYFSPWDNTYLENGPAGEYLTDRLGRAAAAFIHEHRRQPFFLYLSFYAVHTPLEGKERLVERYEARADTLALTERTLYDEEHGNRVRSAQSNPVYAAMVETMDRNVGRVLRALEEVGVDENTIVIFTSDNGGLSVLPRNRRTPPTANRPLRFGKGWHYEGGIRMPLVVRWPGVTDSGSISEEPVSSIDFFPTLLEVAGLDVPADHTLDGVSFVSVLTGRGALEREALYRHYPHYHGSGAVPSGAVRQGDYKLIEYFETGRVELYNLAKDLTETNNLAEERPEKAAVLRAQLEPWWKQLRSLALKGRRFERLDELEAALWSALAYWNAHRKPYRWKKVPQRQVEITALWEAARSLGGYGWSLAHKTIMT